MRAATGEKVRAHKGGGGTFSCVAFTPDGKRCIAAHVKAARAGKSYLLDVDARAGKAKKVELRQVVWSIAVRARDGMVALGTKGKDILLFDASCKALGKLKQPGVCRLAFSADGERLFAASESGEISRFVLPEKIVKNNLPEAERAGEGDAGLRGMAVDLESETVFVGGQFGSVALWRADGTSPEVAGGIEAHSDQVKAVCLRPDGSVVTSGWDGKLLLWPAEGGGAELLYSHGSRLEEAFLTPDGKRAAVVGREQAFLVDVDQRKLLARWPKKGAKKIRSMGLSPDGSVIALGIGVEVCFFSLPSFKPIGKPTRAAGDTIDALWCLDNKRAIAGAEDGLVSLVDAQKGVVWTLGDHGRDLIEGEVYGNPHKDVAGIAVNRAGTLLATAATDQSVRIYRLGKGNKPPQRVQRALLDFSLFSGLAFITDERLAATTDELDVIDAQSGELLLHLGRADFDGEEATRPAVRPHPDGGTELLIGTENGSIYAVQISPA
jgi:WD40 repeat protein